MAYGSRYSWRNRDYRRAGTRVLGGAQPGLHGRTGDDPGAAVRRRWGTFAGPRLPAGLVDAGTAYAPGPGGLAAAEPRDHYGTDVGLGYDDRGAAVAAHQVDAGTVAARQRRPVRRVDGVDSETDMQVVQQDIYGGSRAALVRGDNALPENNPDGYRLGQRVRRTVNRRMYLPRIVHTDRPVPIRTAPDPIRSDPPGGPRSSPFPFGALAKQRNQGRPIARRVPASADQGIVPDDGSDANRSAPPQFWASSVFG